MAIVNKAPRSPWTRKHKALFAGFLILSVLIALLAYNFNSIRGQMAIGTAYAARVTCSCHYVGGRNMDDCRKDFEPGMELINLTLDDQSRRVTASALMMESATAEFREGWGCILLNNTHQQAE